MLSFARGDQRGDGAAGSAARPGKEAMMYLRFALSAATIALATTLALAEWQPAQAQTPPAQTPQAQTPPPATAPTPGASPAAAPSASPSAGAQSSEPFGEDTTLTAKMIVYLKGTGTWDNAFETITGSFKKLKAYADKEGLKSNGMAMTVFTATDDTGFQYQAAIPITEAPKNPPHGDMGVGQSPEGHALKFIHHGSYDDLDNTYEAITNYLDEKRLEAKDLFIEEYVSDPLTADPNKLTVNVFVLLK